MRPLPLFAAALAVFVSWTPALAEDAAESAADNTAAFKSMGYAMASQLRLNIGFSEEELASVFEGMRMAAMGEDEPANFQEAIAEAQQIYMGRMQAFQEEEETRAAALAETNKTEAESYFEDLEEKEGVVKTATGLYYEMIEEGTGERPDETSRVKVNYRGVLLDGREFDSGENAEFMVNRVVPGFSEGLQLLKEGGKIKLHIPSELGYGDRPSRPGSIIEPGDALIFEVELLEVADMPTPPQGPPPNLPPDMEPPPPPPSGPPPGPPPAPPSNSGQPPANPSGQ
ncbi:MAG: FKBP-type peptidyl-prolyl cis-trans isomerase [Oceanipulchritudo sp.]